MLTAGKPHPPHGALLDFNSDRQPAPLGTARAFVRHMMTHLLINEHLDRFADRITPDSQL